MQPAPAYGRRNEKKRDQCRGRRQGADSPGGSPRRPGRGTHGPGQDAHRSGGNPARNRLRPGPNRPSHAPKRRKAGPNRPRLRWKMQSNGKLPKSFPSARLKIFPTPASHRLGQPTATADRPAARNSPVHCRGAKHQADRRHPQGQPQDRGIPSYEVDGRAGPP